jgi:hypothetical protein
MPQEQKYLHIVTETIAVFVLVPFLFTLSLNKSLNIYSRIFLFITAILTIIIDGYLLVQWILQPEDILMNTEKQNMLSTLIRQSSRWTMAAKQDLSPLIKVLHSNYGAGYLWAMKDIFTEKEINSAMGSEELRKKFEYETIKMQDESTRAAVKECPDFTPALDFIAQFAGEA